VDVAHEQVEVLRRGVSDIFVTMARRNRSLIDRQLAMLDEYEASVDDSEVLSNYYQLDHLATRMRRNSESLLVLASAEPKRRRVKATEIDDVVRASIGEVEDYRRVQIEHLESLQVRGNVVADISHLLAELLDNATAFSPPESPVRVGGRRTGDSYMLRIVDDGVGIATARLSDLNELLREPPIVGLSVESTLGMSVVSLLASKHGIDVTLSAGNPGLTVDIVLPGALFGPIDAPTDTRSPTVYAPFTTDDREQLVAWDDNANGGGHAYDETFQQSTPSEPDYANEGMGVGLRDSLRESFSGAFGSSTAPSTPEPAATFGDDEFELTGRHHDNSLAAMAADFDERPPVAQGDWTKMALNLSAFRSGMAAAQAPDDTFDAGNDAGKDATSGATLAAAEPDSPNHGAAPAFAGPGTGADPLLPPARRAEFDAPPAPPVTVGGHAQRPVSPDTARQAPLPRLTPPSLPGLPTRQPGAGPSGPDRMTDSPVAAAGDPGALQSALSAFDNARNGDGGALPTRSPSGDTGSYFEEQLATSQSRLDPDALRERLRAFQTEFRTATDTISAGNSSTSTTDTQIDLGGDHR
ncbi:MAG: ATP-binding protein, partial [Ilumatobacteraceae bacterium]